MKRPFPVIIAATTLGLRGSYAIYMQCTQHYTSGALGNVGTLGVFMIVCAAMLFWKVKGWRWVAFAFFMVTLLGGLSRLSKIQNDVPVVNLIYIVAETALCCWLAYALAGGSSVKNYLAAAFPPQEKKNA